MSRRRAAARLAFLILAFSSVIALLGTSLQLYLDYSTDQQLLEAQLAEITEVELPSLATSLWVSDQEQIALQLSGILHLPHVERVAITGPDGPIAGVGVRRSRNIISRAFSIRYRYKGEDRDLGTLEVAAGLDAIQNRILHRVLVILVTQGVKTFLVSAFILFVFQFLITRHLESMAKHVRELKPERWGAPLVLDRRRVDGAAGDELDEVAEAINALRENLSESYRALALANQELERAVGMRDEFISIASHELNTPLTSLMLAVQGLVAGTIPTTPEALARTFAVIDRQTRRLKGLIEELLSVSRIQSGHMAIELAEVDLSALTREVAATFADQLARANCVLSLRAEAPVVGRWDRSQLERVVANLLSNAIKFGAGKPIALSVEAAVGIAQLGRLTIEDHGIGIPPDRLPHIFDRFERAVSAREFGGLGLGLYIVREIIQQLGGTVTVYSVVGVGSTFTVELPLAGPTTPSDRTP